MAMAKTAPSSSLFRLTTAEQRAAFDRDGYVLIRGLLAEKEVDALAKAADSEWKEGTKEDRNAQLVVPRVALTPSPFQDAALFSDIPTVVAELMQMDPKTQNLRLIHDFFLSSNFLDPGRCDWHVDGHGLWPESHETPSKASQAAGRDQDGINAWVALDDMPVEFAGSMALAPGSHKVPWRYDALRAIGLDGTINGGETREELVDRMVAGKGMVTHPEFGPRIRLCSMGVTSPEHYTRLEDLKHILDLRKGDVVFCSRNLFHRTLFVTDEGREHYQETLGRHHLHRYTIRYTVGSAELQTGFSWMIWSMLMNPEIAGWTLDKVASEIPTYWFPKVWPSPPKDIRQRLEALMPQVEAAKKLEATVQAKLFKEVAAAKEAEL